MKEWSLIDHPREHNCGVTLPAQNVTMERDILGKATAFFAKGQK
jgi:hypothetical protein